MKRCCRYLLLICLLFSFSLIPFGRSCTTPKNRYVTQVEVLLQKGEYRQSWNYIQPKKINSVLNFLRTTNPRGRVYAAQPIAGSHHYCIALYYNDGTCNTYYLQDYLYFNKNTDIWQRVSTSHAQLLYPLLQLLPTDI